MSVIVEVLFILSFHFGYHRHGLDRHTGGKELAGLGLYGRAMNKGSHAQTFTVMTVLGSECCARSGSVSRLDDVTVRTYL